MVKLLSSKGAGRSLLRAGRGRSLLRAGGGRSFKGRMATSSLIVIAALTLAACSSSTKTPAASKHSTNKITTTIANTAPANVKATDIAPYGEILTTGTGMTLYLLTGDSPNASICTSACTAIWPPLTVTGAPIAGPGIVQKLLGTITRTDGSKQITYNGHPLYTFINDKSPGQVNGQGINHFGGLWYVVGATGNAVTTSPPPTSAPASSTPASAAPAAAPIVRPTPASAAPASTQSTSPRTTASPTTSASSATTKPGGWGGSGY